jgi:hypothetical protein
MSTTLPLAVCANCGAETDKPVRLGDSDQSQYCRDCAENLTVCDNCGDVIATDDARGSEDGDTYCESCYDERYTRCESCNREITRDDAIGHNGSDYCESCFDDRYATCSACGDTVPVDDSRNSDDGDTYCESCYWERYTTCDRCDQEIDRENSYCSGDGTYCESCYPGEEWEDGYFTPSDCFDEIRSRRRFGVELETSECGGYENLRDETSFGCKEDGSITGKEFVSPVLSSDDGLAEIRHFCRLARRFDVDDSCGYHLHVDAENLDVTTLQRVALAYLRTEEIWQSFVPEARRENQYCQSIRWSASEVRAVESKDKFRYWASGQDRYQWFNVHSYPCHGSLEIRLHTGTLDSDKVCNWVKAHLRFVDWVVNGGDINRLTGTIQERFAVLSEIWADDDLTAFYVERARKFGTDLAPASYFDLVPERAELAVA